MNFIDRHDELARLQELYHAPQAGMAVVYGRRRLGKTRLLKEFAGKLPHTYFMGDRAGEESLRRAMAMSMSVSLGEPLMADVNYSSWYDLFQAFDRFRDPAVQHVLILDEYQYLCQVQPAFSSFIQKWWDEHWSSQRVVLILCGSITSMMYRETLADSSPLYGRADLRMLLRPIPAGYIKEAAAKEMTERDLVETYSLAGGVPRYLELVLKYQSFDTALRRLVLDRDGPLYSEAKYLLHEEISVPNTCWSLLHELGRGTARISELGSRLNLPANQLTRYMDLLQDLFLIRREVPVLENNPRKSKKGQYQVNDPFLRLWFGSIFPYESMLEFGNVELVLERLKPLLQDHLAWCYEELCREYVRRHAARFGIIRVGRQWGNDYELDVIGVDESGKVAVAGECKWSDQPVDGRVFAKLQKLGTDRNLPISDSCQWLLFGKSGFTSEVEKLADGRDDLTLVHDVFA